MVVARRTAWLTDAGPGASVRLLLVSDKGPPERNRAMTLHYSSPALDAELAYRREVLKAAGRGTRTRATRSNWFRSRRRAL